MPRRRSYRRPYQRREVDYQWVPSVVGFSLSNAGLKDKDVIKFTDIALPDRSVEWTLERVRGEFAIDLGSSPSKPLVGYIFGLIFPDVVYGNDEPGTIYNGTTNATRIPPLPTDNEGSDDFPVCQPLCIVPTSSAVVFTLDSKARRRMDSEHLLSIFMLMHTESGSVNSMEAAAVARTLFRKRS